MTEITYEKTQDYTEITVMGHCNAGRINGMDLCCCGVSMLVFTLLDTLSGYDLEGYRHSYGGGWCHVKFLNSGINFKKAIVATDTIFNGFRLLENRYPSSVKIYNKKGAVVENE